MREESGWLRPSAGRFVADCLFLLAHLLSHFTPRTQSELNFKDCECKFQVVLTKQPSLMITFIELLSKPDRSQPDAHSNLRGRQESC